MGILEVGGNETSVALLACSVPHLQPIQVGVLCDVLDVEVDADSGLGSKWTTLWVSSKWSVVYFSMMEVLPTPWSPRKTTLNFSAFFAVLEVMLINVRLYNYHPIKY